jgi:cbb3-type cytochrome oxidase subunit 3
MKKTLVLAFLFLIFLVAEVAFALERGECQSSAEAAVFDVESRSARGGQLWRC